MEKKLSAAVLLFGEGEMQDRKKLTTAQVEAELAALPDFRLPMPQAYGDPAFMRCLREAIETPELVESFDRLYGAALMTPKEPIDAMIDEATGRLDADMRAFAAFVHDAVYLRVPSSALHAIRLSAGG